MVAAEAGLGEGGEGAGAVGGEEGLEKGRGNGGLADGAERGRRR